MRRFASVITTEPSMMIPKSRAPRLSKLAAMANSCIPNTANIIASGITIATTRPARKFPRRRNNARITKTAPMSRLCFTVPITESVNSVRS